ncbi:MAG: type II secretion system minor pseudopilin GspH, partial [Thiohalomonadales bacterium]|nr:type II secretion system minor pseudopilin GspH [Thiohalomonadales bacterium]
MLTTARHQTGFTLLEILVVLILIGIILSVAVLSTGGGKERELEQEVQRMVSLMQLAKEEAVLNRVELAIKFSPNAYEFLRQENNDWVPYTDHRIFRPRNLGEEYELRLLQDGISVSLQEKDAARIMLLSSGEMTPFELYVGLFNSEQRFHLIGNALG